MGTPARTRRIRRSAAGLLLLALSGVAPAQEVADAIPANKRTGPGLYLTAREAFARWQADPAGTVVLDVRTPEEYVFIGHAPMARNVPLAFFANGWDARKGTPVMRPNPEFVARVRAHVPLDRTLLVMCRSGSRSAKAVDALAKAGYTRVWNVVDGFEGDAVRDPRSPLHGQRARNGWRVSGLPWTYAVDPGLTELEATGAEAVEVPAGEVRRWGSLREVLAEGRTEARIDVRAVARPGVFGVGALAGLRGEVTVADGEIVATRAQEGRAVDALAPDQPLPATVLFATRVTGWKEVRADRDVPPAEFEAWLAAAAEAAGVSLEKPFAFRVHGPLLGLRFHVVDGQCPLRARRTGEPLTSPPLRVDHPRVEGRLVGFHALGAAGVLTHHDSSLHVHAVVGTGPRLTGHVEQVGVAEGAVLLLPR